MNVWNNHRMSSEHNKSPNQLFVERSGNLKEDVVIDYQAYGFDGDVNEGDSTSDDDIIQVVLNPLQCPLMEQQRNIFESMVSPLKLRESIIGQHELGSRYMQALILCHDIVLQYPCLED